MSNLNRFLSKWSILPEYQDAGLAIDPSKLSREQYQKLYDEGRVATYDKAADVYQPPVLPEVSISAKAPKSVTDFGRRFRKKLQEDNPSLAAQLFKLPVEAVAGLPQAAFTYLLDPEKNIVPSQALDVQNPYAAMAVDVVADPTNLVGAGVADDVLKISGKLGKAGSKAGKVLTTKTPLKDAYRISSRASKVEVPNIAKNIASKFKELPKGVSPSDVEAVIQKNLDWVNSDEYMRRRMATTGETKDQIKKSIDRWTNTLQNKTDYEVRKINEGNTSGLYSVRKSPIFGVDQSISVDPKYAETPEQFLNVFEHEFIHGLSPAVVEEKLYKNYPLLDVQATKPTFFQRLVEKPTAHQQHLRYLAEPSEQQARAVRLNNRIRKDLGIEDFREITESEMNKWIETIYNPNLKEINQAGFNDVADLLYSSSGDRGSILNWINKSWALPPVIVAGAAAQQASPEVETLYSGSGNKQQKGGLISKLGYKKNSPYKDSPSLQIDSNYITMQDVDQPLLLVPDGDSPMVVQPESGEYYFPNSHTVTEYPLDQFKSGGLRKSQRDLVEWTNQKWRTKSGKPSHQTGERYLPEAAIKALSDEEYQQTSRKKRDDGGTGSVSKQPEKIANKVRRYRMKEGGSTVNQAGNYTKPGMRKRLFNQIMNSNTMGTPSGKWSARKAQLLAKKYKEQGGGYKEQGGLVDYYVDNTPVMLMMNGGCMECGGMVKYQEGGKITYQTRRLINPEQIQSFDKDKLKVVQQDLKAKGLYTGKIDGIYGPLTDKAIKQYNAKLTETPVTASIPEITIKASKKVKSTPNDLVYTPDEMKEYMDVYKARIEECTAGDAQCLERANRYYNTYVAPLVGAKSSWQELEGELPKGIGSSVDSWDIHGVLREKGGKKIPVPYQLEKQAFMVPPGMEKEYHPLKGQEDLIRSLNIPLGAIIGFGNKGGTSSKYGKGTILYNTKQGAVATEHSARVVGFTPDGIPMVYDYDRIVPLTEYKFIKKGIFEITAPSGTENKTFAQLKNDRNFWKEPPVVNTKSIPLYKGEETHPQLGRKEFVNFQNALLKDKQKIAETLEIDNKKYDDLARVAQALAITETQGGDPIARKFGYTVDKVTEPLPLKTRKEIKIKAFDIDGAGVSQGLTQINEENLFTRPEVTRKLKAMGITQDNFDPYNPHHSAAATMTLANFFMERQEKDIKNNPHQLTPLQVLSYQWNRPGDLRKGTAEGKSIHSKKLANIYNQIPLPSEDEETVINTPVYSPTEVYGGYKAMTLPSSFNFQQGGTVQSFLNKWL